MAVTRQTAKGVEERTMRSSEEQTLQEIGERTIQSPEERTSQGEEEKDLRSPEGQTRQGEEEKDLCSPEGQTRQGEEEGPLRSPEGQTVRERHKIFQGTSHTDCSAGQHNPVHAPIPGLGFRSIKTALAAVFTALIYAFLPGSNPTFACIGAIFGMGADMEESRRSGGNRFFGTVIGGFIGLGLYWLEHAAYPEGCYWLRLPMVFLGIIALISMCVLFHWPGGVQPGGVVLCIILFNTPAHHIDYAIHRMIDTGVGVVIALLVNYFLPRSRLERWFGLDRKAERSFFHR